MFEQSVQSEIGAWPAYQLYGRTWSSDFPFGSRLFPGRGARELTFTCNALGPHPSAWMRSLPIYASSTYIDDVQSLFYLYRQPDYDVLHFTDVVDFYLWPDRIACHLLDPAYAYAVELYFLGLICSLWLEGQGIPAIHASAVTVDGRGVAFLAASTGGKSSLAATFMQAGHPLLTDDVLPIELVGDELVVHPSYPGMRMWPEQARHFVQNHQDLEQAHPSYAKLRIPVGPDGFGTFCAESSPLACIYIPERSASDSDAVETTIVPLSPPEAVIHLISHSFAANIVETMGLQVARLSFFSRLVRRVPVCRLIYPNGVELLPRVRKAVLADLSAR